MLYFYLSSKRTPKTEIQIPNHRIPKPKTFYKSLVAKPA